MADIIDEINEELKQERMQALFAKYGKYVLVLAAAVVTIVVAIQGYNFYQDGVRERQRMPILMRLAKIALVRHLPLPLVISIMAMRCYLNL